MNFGGIAFVKEKSLIVPHHLVESLNSLDENLVGITYPVPEKYKTDESGIDKKMSDFIFTPISYNLWPFLAHMKIRLIEKPGVVHQLSAILEESQISILNAEFHTSGYRYLEWSAKVYFCDIRKKYTKQSGKINFDDIRNLIRDSNIDRLLKKNIFLYHEKRVRETQEKISTLENSELKEHQEREINVDTLREALKRIMAEYSHFKENRIESFIDSIKVNRFKRLCQEIIKYLIKVDKITALKELQNKIMKLHDKSSDEWVFENEFVFKIEKKHCEIDDYENNSSWPPAINFDFRSPLEFHYWRMENEKLLENLADLDYLRLQPFNAKIEHNEIILPENVKDIFNTSLKENNNEASFALVSIDTDVPKLRVRVIPRETLHRYNRVSVSYSSDEETKGFLRTITGALKENGYTLYNMLNQTRSTSFTYETGKIEFITFNMNEFDINHELEIRKKHREEELESVTEEEEKEKLEFQVDREKESILSEQRDGLTDIMSNSLSRVEKFKKVEKQIEVKPLNPFQIFLSFKSSFYFRENLVNMCEEVGEEIGLMKGTFIVVENSVKSTTDSVIENLKKCDGVLQFFMKLGGENEKDFGRWLDAENLAARSLNKPTVRIVDERDEIKPIIAKDTYSREVSSKGDSVKAFKEDVKSALLELILAIKTNRDESGVYISHKRE